MVEEMSKNSGQTDRKRYHKRDKPAILSWESKSATYYQTQFSHIRTQIMQRHRLKLIFCLFKWWEKNNKYSLDGIILSTWQCNWTGTFHIMLLQCLENQALLMTSSELVTFVTMKVSLDGLGSWIAFTKQFGKSNQVTFFALKLYWLQMTECEGRNKYFTCNCYGYQQSLMRKKKRT